MAKPTKLQLLTMGARLRGHRDQLGITLGEVADKLNSIVWERHHIHVAVNGDTVSKHERGERRPMKLTRDAYRVFYNASDEELGFINTAPVRDAVRVDIAGVSENTREHTR